MYQSIEIWKESAKQGSLEAKYKLGLAYWKGNGVEQSDDKATELWRGICVSNPPTGEGLEQNYYIEARYLLAQAYYDGRGIAKDVAIQARKNIARRYWLTLEEAGDKRGTVKIDEYGLRDRPK